MSAFTAQARCRSTRTIVMHIKETYLLGDESTGVIIRRKVTTTLDGSVCLCVELASSSSSTISKHRGPVNSNGAIAAAIRAQQRYRFRIFTYAALGE